MELQRNNIVAYYLGRLFLLLIIPFLLFVYDDDPELKKLVFLGDYWRLLFSGLLFYFTFRSAIFEPQKYYAVVVFLSLLYCTATTMLLSAGFVYLIGQCFIIILMCCIVERSLLMFNGPRSDRVNFNSFVAFLLYACTSMLGQLCVTTMLAANFYFASSWILDYKFIELTAFAPMFFYPLVDRKVISKKLFVLALVLAVVAGFVGANVVGGLFVLLKVIAGITSVYLVKNSTKLMSIYNLVAAGLYLSLIPVYIEDLSMKIVFICDLMALLFILILIFLSGIFKKFN